MVLYWDLIVASTILVNYSFVKTLLVLFKERVVWWRILITLAISLASLLIYFFPGELLFLRYTVGIWMGLAAFPGKLKTKTIQIAGLYVLNYAFIGSLVIFDIQSLFWIIILLFYIVVLYLIINFKIGINQANLTYDVIILPEKHLKAYLDTGNLSMFEGKPLVFLEEKWKNACFEHVGYAKIRSVNGVSETEVYRGPLLQIGQKSYDVYYCFAQLETYDVLLNYLMGVSDD